MTVPTGVGPSGIPINTAAFNSINAKISGLSGQLETLKSNLVFLNKNASS